MNNLSPEIITAIVGAIGLISTAIAAGIKKLFNRVDKMLSELRPNGGSSIKDQVNVNTQRLSRVEERVDQIYVILAKGEKNAR